MFTASSREIDQRATDTNFRTAYKRYAGEADSWFDGTPQSIDTRIARARRLLTTQRAAVARRGAEANRLEIIAELEADLQALATIRHDLLTGSVDREDTSPIAGVHIASSYEEWKSRIDHEIGKKTGLTSGDLADYDFRGAYEAGESPKSVAMSLLRDEGFFEGGRRVAGDEYPPRSTADYRMKFVGEELDAAEQWANENGINPEDYDSDEFMEMYRDATGTNHRHANCGDDEEFADGKHDEDSKENDYLFDEMGRYHPDRFKGKEARNWEMDTWPAEYEYHPQAGGEPRKPAEDDDSELPAEKRKKKESSLSPQDRRYVTLEATRFLADNLDTNDVRELAYRAQHHAELATSTYDVHRSRAITSAFVARVADEAGQRRRSAAAPPRQAASLQDFPAEMMFL